MKCPLKFGLYEFEGGETCVGAECGFYGAVCRNDDLAPLSDVSAADVDANDTSEALGSREKLEADALVLVDNLRMYGGKYAGDAEVEIIGMLDRQAAITERECIGDAGKASLMGVVANERECYEKRITELQAQVDELTAQLRASNAERERLRECLGIATDNAHDLLTLVDESGNVYDRDEGLA